MLYSQRSDTSNVESKLREAQNAEKILEAEAKENKRKEVELSEKMSKETAKAENLKQHKRNLAAQNEFLKKFLTLVTKLCVKTEVTLFKVRSMTGVFKPTPRLTHKALEDAQAG